MRKEVMRLILFLSLGLTGGLAQAAQTANGASAVNWTNCGGPPGSYVDCVVPTDGVVTLRFGANGNYIYYMTEGVSHVPCNGFLGDPAPGVNKSCAYTTADIFGIRDVTWGGMTEEGKNIKVDWGPTWVRFGKNGHWYYTLVSGPAGNTGLDAEVLGCSLGAISNNFDPLVNVKKVCQWGVSGSVGPTDGPFPGAFKSLREQTAKVEGCGSDFTTCEHVPGSPVLVRYGAIDKPGSTFGLSGNVSKYTYRIMRKGDGEFPCNPSWKGFNTDPWVNQHKLCQFAPISAANGAAQTVGAWKKVASCEGEGCAIDHNISVGTEKSDSWSDTKEWAHTVTVSMEKSATFSLIGGAKLKAEVANTFAHSSTVQKALSQSTLTSVKAVCDRNATGTSRALYQFQTTTDSGCLETGRCTGETLTASYFCAMDPPPGFMGPKCLPGYCDMNADPLCGQCAY